MRSIRPTSTCQVLPSDCTMRHLPTCIPLVVLLLLLIAGGGATAARHFDHVGRTWTYSMRTRTTFAEVPAAAATTATCEVSAAVDISCVWRAPDGDEKLLAVRVYDVAPSAGDATLYAIWRRGRIDGVLRAASATAEDDDAHLNLLKGVAGLLQYQRADVDDAPETDASGVCRQVAYAFATPTMLRKTRRDCRSEDLYAHANPTPFLGTRVRSAPSTTDYELADDHPAAIRLRERHEVALPADARVTREIAVDLQMAFERAADTGDALAACGKCASLEDAQRHLQMARALQPDTLLTRYAAPPPASSAFSECVRTHRGALAHYGGVDGALAFLECVQVARAAPKSDLLAALKAHARMRPQLLDVLAHAQTPDAHAAVLQHVRLDDAQHAAWAERYLWALSFSARPHPAVVGDLLHRYTHTPSLPPPVAGTLAATLAAMARNLHALDTPPAQRSDGVHARVTDTLLARLDASSGDARAPLLRALANLQSPAALPRLLQLAAGRATPASDCVLAWRAIRHTANLTRAQTEAVRARALRTFLQLDKREDSSARTLAADVLLADGDRSAIAHLLRFVAAGAPHTAELRQHVLERMRMWRMANATSLRNYDALAPRALSVAMRRQCYRPPEGGARGSLSTVQEIAGGVVKRGVVALTMSDADDAVEQELFALGIFSGGLDAFMSSSSADGASEPQEATAGMELSVLGAHLRPFVFFRGQGELMGHVWSGTASERTVAFQATAMLQDHVQTLRFGNGLHAHVQSAGAAAFELAGHIAISLWHRTAAGGVEQAAGVATQMALTLRAGRLAQMALASTQSAAPQLRLAATIDFAGDVRICMRLDQPEVVYEQAVRRSGAHPGGVRRRRHTAGLTYALNRKNNDMCSAISP